MQDQIAGFMVPRMGEMIRSYVSSVVHDKMQEINRRIEASLSQNRFLLWVRSRASGRSMAELAMADTQRLDIVDIYLIRRGSGELIHHWQRREANDNAPPAGDASALPAPGRGRSMVPVGGPRGAVLAGSNRDTLVSGFLTAITAFAEEAFEADKESLRTLDLDDHRIYIRGVPYYLLAVRCRGTAPAAIEQLFDDELIRVLGEHQRIEQASLEDTSEGGRARQSAANERVLDDLAHRLEAGAAERTQAMSKGDGMRALKTLAWLIMLPLLALAGWHFYWTWMTSELQRKADAVVAGIPALAGYPIKAHVERGGGRLWVTGLVPDEASESLVLGRLKDIAPTATLTAAVSVLPRADVEGRLGAEGLRRALERARPKLTAMASDLGAARERLTDSEDREALARAEAAAKAATDELGRINPAAGRNQAVLALREALDSLRQAADRLAALAGAEVVPPAPPPPDATEAAEALAHVADRISTLVAALEQRRNVVPLARRLEAVGERMAERTAEVDRRAEERVTTLDRRMAERIADLERQLKALAPRPPTPSERLAAFVRANAIFFANDSEYRDAAAASATLDELARLIKAAGEAVRAIGFTDEAGGLARNSPLSQARADKVVAALASRGVPQSLLIAVGRPTGINLAPGTGPDSGNRRVEFEIAFKGERRSGP
jgi:outer membrane protein OmpA-like peptidoglycan-associated protein